MVTSIKGDFGSALILEFQTQNKTKTEERSSSMGGVEVGIKKNKAALLREMAEGLRKIWLISGRRKLTVYLTVTHFKGQKMENCNNCTSCFWEQNWETEGKVKKGKACLTQNRLVFPRGWWNIQERVSRVNWIAWIVTSFIHRIREQLRSAALKGWPWWRSQHHRIYWKWQVLAQRRERGFIAHLRQMG